MQQQTQTVLREHKPQTMNGQNGAWTLHKFKADDGNTYEASKQDLANAAFALIGQPVLITFEIKQNGQYTNYRLQSVQAVGANGATMAPGVFPLGSNVNPAPTTPQAAPAAPAQGGGPKLGYETPAKDAGRIARSVGLELAIKATEGGVVTIGSVNDLFDVAGSFAEYIFKGSRPGGAVAAPSSSGAVGGDATGAASFPAPVESAPQPVAEPTVAPDDDIPF